MASLLPAEDPKYKAHRDSLNLQHPQPRPGPTHRYQTALESQAQNYNSPTTPNSLDWGGSQTSLSRLPPQRANRYSDQTNHTEQLSPVSDDGSNRSRSQPPARPPKELIPPERPPKIKAGKLQKPSPLGNEHLNADDQSYGQTASEFEQGSPRIAQRSLSGALAVPLRKPAGPRSISSASKSGEVINEDSTLRRNKNRDTFGTIASSVHSRSETF